MDLINKTPFAVITMLWEDLQGQPKLSIIIKGTFAIKNTEVAAIATEQLPILIADELYGGNSTAAVRFESDRVPFKPRTDVVLIGRSHAPVGRPVTQLDVTLRVGRMAKTIRVFGNRQWWFPTKFIFVPLITPPHYFLTMDLVYERAFGGIDAAAAWYCKENLIGKGFIGKKSKRSIHNRPLPNLEDPARLIRSWRSRPRPVGFGFYGRGWMPRLGHAGTYDEQYRKGRAPAPPLDFSYAFYNGAHPDLQVEGYLRGDEEVELTHVSPEPILRFRLPGVQPKITIAKWTVPPEDWIEQNATEDREVSVEDVPTIEETIPAVLDTLVLIPDEKIFYQVFRGVYPLATLEASEVARVKITI
jgi:hypothetical protein